MLDLNFYSMIKIFCHIFLLVCTGAYRATNELVSRITDTDEYQQAVESGLLLAAYLNTAHDIHPCLKKERHPMH